MDVVRRAASETAHGVRDPRRGSPRRQLGGRLRAGVFSARPAAMTRQRAIVAALIVCAAGLRLYAFAHQDLQIFSDLIEFDKVAAQPVTSVAFWAGSRPPAVPFVHKLLD